MNPSFTSIGDLGRDGLIRRLADVPTASNLGDDAAVLPLDDTHSILLTSETFVEGVDFDLTYTPFHHLGYKLVNACVSDILAMNGLPETILVNLAVPNRISMEMIDSLYQGIAKANEELDLALVGGDVTASPGSLAITITATGKVDNASITFRKGARVGDALCVSGDLGAAYAGLKILLREKRYWQDHGDDSVQPILTDFEAVIRAQLVPQVPIELVKTMHRMGIRPSSMIDISKHMLREVIQLGTSSDVGVYIYSAALPVSLDTRAVADEFEEDVDQYALQGGEDYQLLFTLNEADVNRLSKEYKDLTVIGKIVPRGEGIKMQSAEGDIVSFDADQG
jgi:thiamine-monophosphate kinase